MIAVRLPNCVERLLWDVDVAQIDPDRDRALIMERVMSRGTWEAMKWLRARYGREQIASFLRGDGLRRLSPRDIAYWAVVCELDLEAGSGGGRPGWAGP